MGFFTKKTTMPATGLFALPEEIQDTYTYIANDINNLLTSRNNTREGYYDMFVPMAETADETAAFDAIRQGFTPTSTSLNADISMFQNPYNNYVIDEINRQGQGQYSLLKQALNESGQMGSNRSILGANDIDLTRTGQIGRFLQDQYNNSLNYAMQMPGYRAADAQSLLGIGDFQRNLDLQTKQAPLSALMAAAQASGALAPATANPGTPATTIKSGGGLGGVLGGLGSIGSIASGISAFGGLGGMGSMLGSSGGGAGILDSIYGGNYSSPYTNSYGMKYLY